MNRVFVIVPAYNAEPYIKDCLDSLIGQRLTDWQAIVIDDGSTDGTLSVALQSAAQDARIHIEAFPNGGVAAARNRGLARIPADAQYVLLLDNDDCLVPDALETLVGRLEQRPDAVAAYGLSRFIDGPGRPIFEDLRQAYGAERQTLSGGKLVLLPPDAPTPFQSFVTWPMITTPGQVLIRASALTAVGEFDSHAVPSDDWDMWIRLSSQGDFVFARQFVINKREHGANASVNKRRMGQAEVFVRRKLACSSLITHEQWIQARAGHQAACAARLEWVTDALRDRKVLDALRNAYHAGKSYIWFVQTWARRNPTDATVQGDFLQLSQER